MQNKQVMQIRETRGAGLKTLQKHLPCIPALFNIANPANTPNLNHAGSLIIKQSAKLVKT